MMQAAVMSRPKSKRNDVAVKIDASVAHKAKMVAANRSITLAEYLTSVLKDKVAFDFLETAEQMTKAAKQKPK